MKKMTANIFRLAEMSVGFSEGNLEVGDTGESLGDIDIENEYTAPLGLLVSLEISFRKGTAA